MKEHTTIRAQIMGLERFNRTIKEAHTLRSRLPFAQFLATAEKIIQPCSADPNYNDFSTTATYSMLQMKDAYNWKKLDISILKLSSSDDCQAERFAVLPTHKKGDMTIREAHGEFQNILQSETWEQFKRRRMSCWIVSIKDNMHMPYCSKASM